jgi:hypothetical protein
LAALATLTGAMVGSPPSSAVSPSMMAYQLIRSHALTNNASLRAVAEAIVAVGQRV